MKSVVDQTYGNLEIILVNDGSLDNTLNIIREWEKKDNRIKIIDKENGGPAVARNCALDNMTGDYVCFIDSDDYVDKDYIKTLSKVLEDNSCDLSMLSFTEVSEETGEERVPNRINKEYIFNSDDDIYKAIIDLINYDKFPHVIWGKLYKGEIIRDNNLRFCDRKIAEDLYFNAVYLLYVSKAVLVDKPLYYYVKRLSGSLTNNGEEFRIKESKDVIGIIESYCKENNLLKDREINFYYLYLTLFNKFFRLDVKAKKDWQKAIKNTDKEYFNKAVNYIDKNRKYYKKFYGENMSDIKFRLLVKNYKHYNNPLLTKGVYPIEKNLLKLLSVIKYKVKR